MPPSRPVAKIPGVFCLHLEASSDSSPAHRVMVSGHSLQSSVAGALCQLAKYPVDTHIIVTLPTGV